MPKKAEKKVNKSAWIRQQAASLSAKEVVDKAKSQGITLSLAQVYTARSTAKTAKKAAAAAVPGMPVRRGPGRPSNASKAAEAAALAASKTKAKAKAPARPKFSVGDLDQEWVALTIKIGTRNARNLLDQVEALQARAG